MQFAYICWFINSKKIDFQGPHFSRSDLRWGEAATFRIVTVALFQTPGTGRNAWEPSDAQRLWPLVNDDNDG